MNNIKSSPRDFFLYLLVNIALYYNAIWLIVLWHQYINHFLPQSQTGFGAVYYSSGIPEEMRWAIASLIVVFPAYIIVSRYLNKDLAKNPEKKDLRIRRWLIHFTLSIAAVTLVIDLIALIFNLLEGDFALRFILKVVAIFIVAGLVFGYYFYELRRDAGKSAPQRGIFRWIAILLVIASIVGGFFIVGSPTKARQLDADNTRVRDLQLIQSEVVNYWQTKEELPGGLVDLEDDIYGFRAPTDPETEENYAYNVIDELSFSLCATFNFENDDIEKSRVSRERFGLGANWDHDAGRVCFSREIDPERHSIIDSAPSRALNF